MKIELTIEEANALINLIDLAVKAGGIQVAPMAVAMMQKLREAADKKGPE